MRLYIGFKIIFPLSDGYEILRDINSLLNINTNTLVCKIKITVQHPAVIDDALCLEHHGKTANSNL
jgi:hypothetical protein